MKRKAGHLPVQPSEPDALTINAAEADETKATVTLASNYSKMRGTNMADDAMSGTVADQDSQDC